LWLVPLDGRVFYSARPRRLLISETSEPQPAAHLESMTAHGGIVVGMGVTVLV
jgi:hypothetical protein